MTIQSRTPLLFMVCVVCGAGALRADEKPPIVPLKVQIVISRYQGEKKVSSLPYTLAVNANLTNKTSLRVGSQVPIVATFNAAPSLKSRTYEISYQLGNVQAPGYNEIEIFTTQRGNFRRVLSRESMRHQRRQVEPLRRPCPQGEHEGPHGSRSLRWK